MIKEIYTTSDYNSTTKYTYDEMNRLTKEEFSSGDSYNYVTQYTYDMNGNLIKETETNSNNKTSIYDYVYNENQKLIEKIYTDTSGNKYTTTYEYDESGNTIKTSGSSNVTTVEYRLIYSESGKFITTLNENVEDILKLSLLNLHTPYCQLIFAMLVLLFGYLHLNNELSVY